MGKFLSHEAIAGGAFNEDFNSSGSLRQAWANHLGNTLPIVTLVIQRLSSDYANLNPKMRKAYTAKDIVPWFTMYFGCYHVQSWLHPCWVGFFEECYQKRSALFLAAMSLFENDYPKEYVEQDKPNLTKAFLGCHELMRC